MADKSEESLSVETDSESQEAATPRKEESSSSEEEGKLRSRSATVSALSALDALGGGEAPQQVQKRTLVRPVRAEKPEEPKAVEKPKQEAKDIFSREGPNRLEAQAEATAKWERQQTTAFTYWVNVMLSRRQEKIEDLRTGFHTGVKLAILAEVLVGKKINEAHPPTWRGERIQEKPKMIAHKITNNFLALRFLKEVGGAKALTLSAEQCVETTGDLKYILGFCWQLLKTFQEPPDSDGDGKKDSKSSSYEARLLNWVKTTLGRADGQEGGTYGNVDLSNGFKSDGFRNGTALMALVHNFDNSFCDYSTVSATNDSITKSNQCTTALALAQEKMNIPSIIEGDDLAQGEVGDKQLTLYLSLLYNAYQDKQRSQSAESLKLKTQNLDQQLRTLQEENAQLKAINLSLTTQSEDLKRQLSELEQSHGALTITSTETQSKIDALNEKWTTSTEAWDSEINSLKSKLAATLEAGDATQMDLHNRLEDSSAKRDAVREELKRVKAALNKEKEELEKLHKKLLKQEARAKKNKEDLEKTMNDEEKALNQTLGAFRKHCIIHLNDMNTWRPILEDQRETDWKSIQHDVPSAESIEKKPFNDQITALSTAVQDDGKSMRELLSIYESETAEMVAITVGKRKKRVKHYAWEQEFPKDLATAKMTSSGGAVSPRSAGKEENLKSSSKKGDDQKSPRSEGRKRGEAKGKR